MNILVLGIGNTLLTDEGVGVVAMQALASRRAAADSPGQDGGNGREAEITYLDGGTLSFTLAVPIAEAAGLLIFDAAMLDGPPGTVATFEGDAMDAFLGANRQSSVHEVGLSDLMTIARLGGNWPARRALVGVRPQRVDWGEQLTPAVAAAVGPMVDAADAILCRWQHAPA